MQRKELPSLQTSQTIGDNQGEQENNNHNNQREADIDSKETLLPAFVFSIEPE
jgi:hypothetical protein